MSSCIVGIYAIRNDRNGKMYIGSSIDVVGRVDDHFKRLRHGSHDNQHLQNAFNLYGEPSFSRWVVKQVHKADLLTAEKFFMESFEALDRRFGYNIAPAFRNECTDEMRKRISQSLKGRPFSEEHKRNLATARIGCRWSEESKERKAQMTRGIKRNPYRGASVSAVDESGWQATFKSISAASRFIEVDRKTIRNRISNGQKYNGFKWVKSSPVIVKMGQAQ